MLELFEVEICAELAIDTSEEIEIEFRGQSGRVVVGSMKGARVLHQIDPDDQRGAGPEHAPGMAQEGDGFLRLEIANSGSREEPGMPQSRHGRRQRRSEERRVGKASGSR